MNNTQIKDNFILDYEIQPMNLEKAGYISSIVKKILNKKGYDKHLIRRVSIATYEAEINVVIHSYGGFCHIEFFKNKLRLIFEDKGPGINNIEQAMIEGFSTACDYAIQNGFGAGMGLPNIKKSSDFFDINSNENGTRLTIEFDLPHEEKKYEGK